MEDVARAAEILQRLKNLSREFRVNHKRCSSLIECSLSFWDPLQDLKLAPFPFLIRGKENILKDLVDILDKSEKCCLNYKSDLWALEIAAATEKRSGINELKSALILTHSRLSKSPTSSSSTSDNELLNKEIETELNQEIAVIKDTLEQLLQVSGIYTHKPRDEMMEAVREVASKSLHLSKSIRAADSTDGKKIYFVDFISVIFDIYISLRSNKQ